MEARKVAFADVQAGILLHENGTCIDAGEPFSLSLLLDFASSPSWENDRPDVVYVVGCYNAASTPPSEWFESPAGWERVSYHRNPLIATFKGVVGSVRLYGSSQWFGQVTDIHLIRQAYMRLEEMLRKEFGQEFHLMGTPARSGLDLIERALPETKDRVAYEWPVLEKEIREVIEKNIGQGRMEMLRHVPNMPATNKLYVIDAIWMYSACCRRLPSGQCQHDTIDEFAGYRVGFYRVEFQVPPGWNHIGLLPTWNPKERRSVWPSRPSTYWYTSYCCAEELRLALEQKWPISIKERWLFDAGDTIAQDPLRRWIERLRKLRDDASQEGPLAPLLRAAIRSLCIKAIGGLHRKGRYQVIETPINRLDLIPDDAEIVWQSGNSVRWRKPIPLDPAMAHFAHPEWSAYIWGRARARLAKAALQLPRECIIALRSDAIALTAEEIALYDPQLQGTKPGEFRLKRIIDLNGRPLPKTTREYLDLLHDEEEDE